MLVGEFAPVFLNPAVDVAIVSILGFAVALGLLAITTAFIHSFFGVYHSTVGWVIGKIPVVGGWVDGKINALEQKSTHYLGLAAHDLEGGIARYWHGLANQLESMGHEIYGLAVAHHALVDWLLYAMGLPQLAALADQLLRLRHTDAKVAAKHRTDTGAVTKPLAHPDTGPIAAGVRIGTKAITADLHRIEHWINNEGTWLDQQVGTAIPDSLEALRERARALEDQAVKSGKYLLTHPWEIAGTAFAGAVAIAIGRLGGGWIRCSNWGRIGRSVCGAPWHLLADALALATDFLFVADMCQILPLLEEGFAFVATPLIGLLAKAGAGLCRGASRAPTLAIPALALPAQVDASLHLAA